MCQVYEHTRPAVEDVTLAVCVSAHLFLLNCVVLCISSVNSDQRSLVDRIEPSLCVLAVVLLVHPLCLLFFRRPQKVSWSLWRHTSTRWRGRNRE